MLGGTAVEVFREASAQTLEVTIAERIWLMIIEVVHSICNVIDLDHEQLIEAVIMDNERIAALYTSFFSTKDRINLL